MNKVRRRSCVLDIKLFIANNLLILVGLTLVYLKNVLRLDMCLSVYILLLSLVTRA